MLRKALPPELRNLKIAQHPIFAMGLLIAALSLAANIGYWTRGLTGQTFWINFVFAGMVEVMFVFLIWLGGNIWKSGGRVLAAALMVLSLAPWLASSVSNFMFLATLKEPQIASAQTSIVEAKEQVLKGDLARYANELTQYNDVIRKDVSALEERRRFCDRASREECSSVELADEIAVNRKINELEASQATALAALEELASQRTNAITDSEFSVALLVRKFDGNWLSREFLMVAFLDILKAVLFLVGIWINLRLYKAKGAATQDQADLLVQLDNRIKTLRELERSIDEKTKAAATQRTDETPVERAEPVIPAPAPKPAMRAPSEPTVPAIASVTKPAPEKTEPVVKPAPTIEYEQRQADGTTVTRRKSIA